MTFYIFLIFAWVVLLSIVLWDLIQKGQSKGYLFVMIPASLFLVSTTYITINSMLGYPTEDIKQKRFTLIASAVQEPLWIYYWVIHEGDTEPRVYKIPYTERNHGQQQETQQQQSKGERIEGKFKKASNMGEGTVGGELEFYKFKFSDKVPKNN